MSRVMIHDYLVTLSHNNDRLLMWQEHNYINRVNFNTFMPFLEQFCDFDIIKGSYYDNFEHVRRIQSTPNGYGNYKDNQQCWASFKCPSDHTVYWRRAWFNTELGF